MNLTTNCHLPILRSQTGFLIKAHDVLCEVRTEGNVDLLVFKELLSLVPPALSYFPDTRPLATIPQPRTVRGFNCSISSNSYQAEQQLISFGDRARTGPGQGQDRAKTGPGQGQDRARTGPG